MMSILLPALCMAQTAKSVLDKTAAMLSHKDGVTANFTMTNSQQAKVSGTVAIKGIKVYAKTPVAVMWFDGKTQWTYLKANDEVSVTNPTKEQLQALNPYNFINLYKSGYKQAMTATGTAYSVHLTATDAKRKIQELFITISKNGYAPTEVKLRQGSRWTTFTISNFKKAALDDAVFRFNSKDFPTAEVIDLR